MTSKQESSNSDVIASAALLVTLWILNLIDAGATYYSTQAGYTWEVNPAMRYLLDWSPIGFLVVKVGLITGICVWGHTRKLGQVERSAFGFVNVVYLALCIQHARVLYYAF